MLFHKIKFWFKKRNDSVTGYRSLLSQGLPRIISQAQPALFFDADQQTGWSFIICSQALYA